MKLKPYLDKLDVSKEYKSFIEENKEAFPVAGFFVLDMEKGENKHQIDYYSPKDKKIAAFTLDNEVQMQLMNLVDENNVPEKIDLKTEVDLGALHGILEDEMKNRGITEDIKKMIVVLQNHEGNKIWNVNCILSGMDLLRAHVEDKSKSVIKMEKVALTDLMKQMPGKMKENLKEDKDSEGKKIDKKELKEELGKLNEIEGEIEKQKDKIEEELKKD